MAAPNAQRSRLRMETAVSAPDLRFLTHRIATAPETDAALIVVWELAQAWMVEHVQMVLLRIESTSTSIVLSTSSDLSHHTVSSSSDIEAAAAKLSIAGAFLTSTHWLEGPRGRNGCLILAQHDGPKVEERRQIADQIATALALRFSYEQAHHDLMVQMGRASLMERRLRATDEVCVRATLAAGAAHDIGNLLTSIVGRIQLLQYHDTDTQHEDLRMIELAAMDGNYLLKRILSSRVLTQAEQILPSTRVDTIVQDAIQLAEPLWSERPSPIKVVLALQPTPPVRIHPSELREVLLNFILNSITAMPGGGILTIRASTHENRVHIAISDTGSGIDPSMQRQIFFPTISNRSDGSGLGLSVSHAIVERCGGMIEVASALGEGTIFTIALPALPEHPVL
jgi:signal transduction histidine kinase